MTTATTTRTPRARKAGKPEGQWKIDGTEPLNQDEVIKQEDPGLAARQRVIDIYSKQGFDSIPAEDLAPRFKWLGLYTQRNQNLGGELTSQLSNAELQDKYFMLRVRFDGGRVTPEQLKAVGEISRDYARSTADFTDRQNIQLHWIQIEDVPAIWDKLEAVGLSTLIGCGDVPRVMLGSPVAGVAKDEIIDGTPAIDYIKEHYLLSDEVQNLPRKFKTAVSGNARQYVTHEIQDIAFVGREHPEYGKGFDCFAGGGLSTNPMLARSLGVFVPLERVPEVWLGVVGIFRDYGYRRLRNRARLKFLVAEWGPRSSSRCSRASTSTSRSCARSPCSRTWATAITSACTSSRTANSTWALSPRSVTRRASSSSRSRRPRSVLVSAASARLR